MAFRAQTIMKARLKGAQTGRNLLKKKADALSMRFRQILRKIIEVRAIILFLYYSYHTKLYKSSLSKLQNMVLVSLDQD